MATSMIPRGSLDQPVAALRSPRSLRPKKKGGALPPADRAVCVLEFLRRFAAHRVPGEAGWSRGRRHARFFRFAGGRGEQTAPPLDPVPPLDPAQALDPAVWEQLRDVAAIAELAVDDHLRRLLQRASTLDGDSGDTVSLDRPQAQAQGMS